MSRMTNYSMSDQPARSTNGSCLPAPHSAIYTGTVQHTRLKPAAHRFSYRVFMMYLDLAEVDQIFQNSRFWSAKGPNLAWFRRSDYLHPQTASLDQAVRDCVEQYSGERPDGAIRLLTNLRYFGFLINPISAYYCFDREERLRFIVAEVTSTPWRERTAYVIPCAAETALQHHVFEKSMHVSPFMPMDMEYHWYSRTPGAKLTIHLQNWRSSEQVFHATLKLRRQPARSADLNRLLLSYPLMTAKVAAAIYWQALKLYCKRVPLYGHRKPAGSSRGSR